MADLKDLQEMAKSGEVSKKLLEDEEFKSEFKKIMKEEAGLEITDEQIPEIIKKFENALQDEKILKEAELEAISGGTNLPVSDEDVQKYTEHYERIRRGIGISGSVVSVLGAMVFGATMTNAADKKFEKDREKRIAAKVEASAGEAAIAIGGVALSCKLGDKIATALFKRDFRKRAKADGMDDDTINKMFRRGFNQ